MLTGLLKGLRAALVAPVLAATITALGGTAAAQAPPPELLPDLQGLPAEDLEIEGGAGRRDLRLTTTVANGGAGAFEVFPEVGTGGSCDGDGDVDNDRLAYQRVFNDADGNGHFDRAIDTGSTSIEVGCMIYHPQPGHNHWHFEDLASYDLRIPGTDVVVASTTKVGFCLVDFLPFDTGLPGHPSDEYYDDCGRDATMGISVGWGDTYGSHLFGQSIDITDLPDGEYCLTVTGDPSDIVRETNELNNESRMLIALFGGSVTSSDGPCVARTTTEQTGDLRVGPTRTKCKRKAKGSGKKKAKKLPL